MTGRAFWVCCWLYAIAWVLFVTRVLPAWMGEPPLIAFTRSPFGWLALAPLLIGLGVAVAWRYDRGRPASRSLSELDAQRACRPSPAPVDVGVGRST